MGDLSTSEKDANQNFGLSDVGSTTAPCSKGGSNSTVSPDKKHWVEIALFDQEGKPVPGIPYKITVPGGKEVPGSTDAKGHGRVDGIDAGNCKITFTGLDKDVWKKR